VIRIRLKDDLTADLTDTAWRGVGGLTELVAVGVANHGSAFETRDFRRKPPRTQPGPGFTVRLNRLDPRINIAYVTA